MSKELTQKILTFWFKNLKNIPSISQSWFASNKEFDDQIAMLFKQDLLSFSKPEASNSLQAYTKPLDILAIIILLDQFPRNIYRNTAKAFSFDSLALQLAQKAVNLKFNKELPTPFHKMFMYLPFEHSEDIEMQNIAVDLFTKLGLEQENGEFKTFFNVCLDHAIQHRKVIEKFGRFPHRNGYLGRVSTKEELEFLNDENKPPWSK
ncbi:DUF924-domain-containing protein [Rozella allomycis CSF55]|uniref:DUF924-domain-containing protein n=1 Tax=Rozella allomycis (strain CSF55) TaxID=988480 RepID=A0A4P9YHI1_ROZAC|nr:DUF924-domain-containing protein [Rozella allomycis CSF55]